MVSGIVGKTNEHYQGDNVTDQQNTAIAIAPEDVRDMIVKGEDFNLVDIRNNSGYRRSHLRGAENLPFGATQPRDYESFFPRHDRTMVIYCYNGKVSKLVADTLVEMGYSDVRYMAGGHWKWRFISGGKPNVRGRYPMGKKQ